MSVSPLYHVCTVSVHSVCLAFSPSLSWSLVDAHLRHEHAAYAEVVRSQGPALAATAKAVKAGKHPATALAQYHAGAVFV